MDLSPETRSQLQREAEWRTAEAARLLLEDPRRVSIAAHLDWVETADKILQMTRPPPASPPHPARLAGMVALVCLSLVLLAWTFHPGNNALQLSVTTDSFSLRLAQAWEVELNWPLSQLQAQRLGTVRTASLGEADFTDLALSGPKLVLHKLHLPAGARLVLETGADGLSLFVNNAVVRGELALHQAHLELRGGDQPVLRDIAVDAKLPPETLDFASEAIPEQAVPFRLALKIPADWQLTGPVVQAIAFEREAPPGSNHWVSSVSEASGKLLETGREFTVTAEDWLRLQGAHSTRLRIASQAGSLKLDFQGRTDTLHAGTAGFEQNLTPSWLEYMYRHQQLALLWSALLLLWGVLWKSFSLLQGGKKT
jgi:hypothetical protein